MPDLLSILTINIQFVSLRVCHIGKNMILTTRTVAGTATKYFRRCFMPVCLPVDSFYQRVSVTTMQGAVTKLHRCVVEIKTKAEVQDGRGPSKGTGNRGHWKMVSCFSTETKIMLLALKHILYVSLNEQLYKVKKVS